MSVLQDRSAPSTRSPDQHDIARRQQLRWLANPAALEPHSPLSRPAPQRLSGTFFRSVSTVKRRGRRGKFHTSLYPTLGENFWQRVFPRGSAPLRGWAMKSVADPETESRPSLSSCPSSLSTLYAEWRDKRLTRHLLRDYTMSVMVDPYLSRETDCSLEASSRSPWLPFFSSSAVVTEPHIVSPGRTSAPTPISTPLVHTQAAQLGTCLPTSSVLPARSQSPRPLKRPLTPAGSRGPCDCVGAVGVATLPGEVLTRSHLNRGPTHLLTSFNCIVCLLKEGLIRDSCSDSRESKRSACGTLQSETLAVVPICGHLDSIRSLMLGDVYIGRGARERDLPKSIWGNPFKVAKYERRMGIDEYAKTLVADGGLHTRIWTLSRLSPRLSLHPKSGLPCRLPDRTQSCHVSFRFRSGQSSHRTTIIRRLAVPCQTQGRTSRGRELLGGRGNSSQRIRLERTWTAHARRHRQNLPRILRHLLHQAVGPSRLGGIHRAQFAYVSLNGS